MFPERDFQFSKYLIFHCKTKCSRCRQTRSGNHLFHKVILMIYDEKSYLDEPLGFELPMFSEHDFDSQWSLVSQWIIRYFEKSKSRSENIVFYNQNWVFFDENHQKSSHFHCKTQRFQNAIFTFQNLKYSHWKS